MSGSLAGHQLGHVIPPTREHTFTRIHAPPPPPPTHPHPSTPTSPHPPTRSQASATHRPLLVLPQRVLRRLPLAQVRAGGLLLMGQPLLLPQPCFLRGGARHSTSAHSRMSISTPMHRVQRPFALAWPGRNERGRGTQPIIVVCTTRSGGEPNVGPATRIVALRCAARVHLCGPLTQSLSPQVCNLLLAWGAPLPSAWPLASLPLQTLQGDGGVG